MLDEKLADKYCRERLYSESNKPDYTSEELKGQEKIRNDVVVFRILVYLYAIFKGDF